ncbi:NAD-dependent epimerase/dehydratase family protein [Cohnella faecalis]|uniref:NAD-dependent epimerase/dehydratase family protein n=1 Tax=Cohnella faecalis TaxID=2315694 RepID=A0A398CS73_9BACL|nr:NAD-dependent epimerase/dehydratase family protein [Cohnella faecalis]RIE01794.1 NAD-dependent epimerase/dehydratase family protein [Cohnella faecalis]
MNVVLGTGPLGVAVMRELAERGESVTMVSFSGKAKLPQGVRIRKADLMDRDQAVGALKQAKVIYQCAQPSYHKWPAEFPTLQDNVVAGAIAAKAKLVVAENVYMYGFVKGSIREELPYAPNTRKGKVRAALSRQLLKLHQDGALQVAMGRGADFFGPHVHQSSAGSRFFKPIAEGKACVVMGDPDKKHSYTYIDDFGKALVVLSEHEDAFGQAWHVPNAEAVTPRELANMAYKAAGFSPVVKSMGKGTLRAAGLFIPGARESVEMMYQFENDFIVDSRKFTERFGMQATPLDIAADRTLAWFKNNVK